ncbi:MAG TPA: response regulator transcription factor [Kiloniellaceae bacterium]|nr:response regulator transcription factor [Kiloniellaceae bacterium]
MISRAMGEERSNGGKVAPIPTIVEVKKPEPNHRPVLALLDPRPLTRESFSQLFRAATRDYVILPLSGPEDLLDLRSDVAADVKLVVLNIASRSISDKPVREDIRMLRHSFRDCPIIILGDRTNGSQVTQAAQQGVNGYIPTTLTATVVKEALRLVRAGGIFLPAGALVDALAQLSTVPSEFHIEETPCNPIEQFEGSTPTFTPRQQQVLAHLCRGDPNKVIAYELNMQESTVKVHIRQIMKKLKATNRTQAALYAMKLVGSSKP